jgi:two-component system, NarL family, response regulator NreC
VLFCVTADKQGPFKKRLPAVAVNSFMLNASSGFYRSIVVLKVGMPDEQECRIATKNRLIMKTEHELPLKMDGMMKIRILLADDHKMVREGLRALIEKEKNLDMVGETDNGIDTVRQAVTLSPHVIIMDVAMPDLNGIEATRQIIQENPHVKIVAMSGHLKKEYVRRMLEAGASAYLVKNRAYEELLKAIHEVQNGRKYLSPEIAQGVVDEYVKLSGRYEEHGSYITLTDREREVLQLLSEGYSTKEMASTLCVSVKTIETHRRNIMEKLNLHSVAELTKYAISEGITTIDT